MDDIYSTAGVCKLFGVTHQTVKNWAREFAEYLSPSATPQEGKKRNFVPEDLRVLALVREYSERGFNYKDVHMALRAGQRGDIPSPQDLMVAPPPPLLARLQEEISGRERIIQSLTSDRDRERGKVELLEKQLAEKERQIRDLYMELAEERVKRRFED